MKDPFEQLDIIKTWEYVGGELPAHLKTHGWTPARCPIHGGFSASINTSLNKWHCFGCDPRDNHGDGYDLIRLTMGVTIEQARELATEASLGTGGGDLRKGLQRKPRGSVPRRGTQDRRPDSRGPQDRVRRPR